MCIMIMSQCICYYSYLAMFFSMLSSAAAWVASWTKPLPSLSVLNLEAFYVEPFKYHN